MRRYVFLGALIIGALTSWPATQSPRRGTFSRDLASVGGDRVRVIVQADDRGLNALTSKHARGLRRRLADSVALDVATHELDALKRDSSVLHISRDLAVSADMALTNKVTRADAVWKGTSGLLGLLGGTPGYNGTGVAVAVVDSGIAAHSAIGSRSSPGRTSSPANRVRPAATRSPRISSGCWSCWRRASRRPSRA